MSMVDDLTVWLYPFRSGLVNIIYVVVLGIVLLLGSFLIGGTYTIVPVTTANGVGSFVMNRYTGTVWLCNTNNCRQVPNRAQTEPTAN
jgi:hypothetical protein